MHTHNLLLSFVFLQPVCVDSANHLAWSAMSHTTCNQILPTYIYIYIYIYKWRCEYIQARGHRQLSQLCDGVWKWEAKGSALACVAACSSGGVTWFDISTFLWVQVPVAREWKLKQRLSSGVPARRNCLGPGRRYLIWHHNCFFLLAPWSSVLCTRPSVLCTRHVFLDTPICPMVANTHAMQTHKGGPQLCNHLQQPPLNRDASIKGCVDSTTTTPTGTNRVSSLLVQTRAIYGTDVHIPIQTVIQTVAIYGTDVQTMSIFKGYNFRTPKSKRSVRLYHKSQRSLWRSLCGYVRSVR